MSSLAAAWDLVRKGWGVVLFSDEQGGTLLDLPEERLPREALSAEIEVMKGLGVSFEPGLPEEERLFDRLLGDYGAVYVGCDDPPLPSSCHAELAQAGSNRPDTDLQTLATSKPGIFAGGFGLPDRFSPVTLAAEGRKGAVSIDRHLQKVSMTAGREREGPFKTRLYTPVEGVETKPSAPMADSGGYQPEEASAEASRCLQCECMACVQVCPYLERFKAYPRKYAREIYNNLAVVHGLRQANTLINSCSWCRLCATVCPNDFDMGVLTRHARQEMVRTSKMPPSAHGFALEDFAFNTSGRFALARAEPGSDQCEHLFFPGCQLAGASPAHTRAAWGFLRDRLPGGVGLMLHCCGAPAAWAGREGLLEMSTAWLRENWERLGRPRLIMACTTCLATFEEQLPEGERISLWEVFRETGLPEGATGDDTVRMLHDPCTTREMGEVREAVRDLVMQLGLKVESVHLSGLLTECCSWGGLMDAANPDMGREQALRRARRSDREDVLAYCAMCRDQLSRSGKGVGHLLDFIFPSSGDAVQPVTEYPLVRKGPDLPDRHENRARLKKDLLREIWNEETAMEEWEHIELVLGPEVRDLVDDRRILVEDIRRTIHAAEAGAGRLLQPESGHFLASHAPGSVTFWVEYEPQDGAFLVHRAWSHRMVLEVG